MKLTTSTGQEVEVPLTLPDCYTFHCFLPERGEVHRFTCWPSGRDTPETAGVERLAFAAWKGPGVEPYVTPEDMGAEQYTTHSIAVAARKPSPYPLLSERDAAAVAEAAGDVLDWVRAHLGLSKSPADAVAFAMSGAAAPLLAIADMRSHEVGQWEAWERLPDSLRRCIDRLCPRKPDDDGDSLPSTTTLERHMGQLFGDAAVWSREKAEREEAEAKRLGDSAPSGSERGGGR